MKVTVRYTAQVRRAAGVSVEEVHLDQPCTLAQLLRRLAERHGDAFGRMVLLDGAALLFVNAEQVAAGAEQHLHDGDVVSVLGPIAGG
jgi:molybdopterin converting factor small subunit